jgi:MoaA/NifB/PqqE/SkfB family radical SAM enzyme
MCNTWKNPTKKDKEFTPDLLNKVPHGLNFTNITGGEPFLRDDLDQIVQIAINKTKRLVISTNGYFTKKMVRLAESYVNRIGFRISIEGLPAANDELRGIKNGFDHGLRTILRLKEMGVKDIGFGSVISHNVTAGLLSETVAPE